MTAKKQRFYENISVGDFLTDIKDLEIDDKSHKLQTLMKQQVHF